MTSTILVTAWLAFATTAEPTTATTTPEPGTQSDSHAAADSGSERSAQGSEANTSPTSEAEPLDVPSNAADVSAPSSAEKAAPSPSARNALFLEALGNGLLYSLNYERFIDDGRFGLRAGASYFTYAVSSYGSSGNLTLFTFPMTASYYFGSVRHKLHLGLGATILHSIASSDSLGIRFEGERSGTGIAATAIVGYRYVPPDGGISFGIGLTPLARPSQFLAWGGAHVGYVF